MRDAIPPRAHRAAVAGAPGPAATVAGMPGNPLTDPNWASDLTDQITTVVGNIRDKTTNNAIKIVRGVVFGLMGAILGIVAVVLLLITLTRGLQSLLDIWFEWDKAVWMSYFVIGGILTIAGWFLMTKRHSTEA
jgi:hypothetical protein